MPPIVLLHLSDLHFGPHSRFAGIDPSKLGERFHRELVEAQKKLGIDSKIDLVAVTGDIAEAGKRSEFEAGRVFLTALAGRLKLGTDRFVFVPGNHDINWASCKRVEAELEEAETLTEENLRSRIDEVKLDLYFEFQKKFYGVDDLDETSERLSRAARLHRFPDLRIAVAGLDSCERESHRPADHLGEIGEEQAESVMAALRRDDVSNWIKIVLVHHNPDATTRNNLEIWRKYLLEKGSLEADLLARFEADALGLHGWERLKAVTADSSIQLLLHGHQHARDKKTWDWRSNGRTHVVSAGSLALQSGVLPKDEPASAGLIVLDPPTHKVRFHSLTYFAWNRAEGSTESGGFAVDPAIGSEQGLCLPSGYDAANAPRSGPAEVANPALLKSYRDRLRDVYTRWDIGSLGALRPGGARGEDAALAEMYVEIRFRKESARGRTAKPLRPKALLHRRKHTVLRGTGGSGKTTWARYTFTKLIEDARFLPMMLVLRDVARQWQQPGYDNDKKSIDQALQMWIVSHGWSGRLKPFLTAETGPRPVLLVDGWDELGPLGSDLRGKLLGFLREHPRVLAVVTSRPYGTERPSHGDGFEVLDLEPLALEDIETLTRRFFERYPSSVLGGRDSADAFLKALSQSPEAQDLVKMPLLLTMMLLVGHAEPLPEKRHVLYEKCVDALLHVRPEQKEKEGALRESHLWCPSDLDTRRRWVAELAFRAQTEGYKSSSRAAIVRSRPEMRSFLTEGSPEEKDRFLSWLVETAGLLIDRADGSLAFSHLSFQEYLTARHLETNAKDASGRLEDFRRGIRDVRWWETLRLLAAQVWGRNPKFLESVLEALLAADDIDALTLAGVFFADGLGTEPLFESWIGPWTRGLLGDWPTLGDGARDVWAESRNGRRTDRMHKELCPAGRNASWPGWLRLERFSGYQSRLELPNSLVARILVDRHKQLAMSQEAIAAGRIFAGARPLWPNASLGLLQLWPGRRRSSALRIQLAVATGVQRSQLPSLAGRFLNRFGVEGAQPEWAHDLARDFADRIARTLASRGGHNSARRARSRARRGTRDFARDWARDFARNYAQESAQTSALYMSVLWAFDWESSFDRERALSWEHSFDRLLAVGWGAAESLPRHFARKFDNAPETACTLDFTTADFLSASRSGARAWVASLAGILSLDPQMKSFASACRLSLDNDRTTPLLVQNDISDPLWPALARHIARRSTPKDRALLEDLARHPEKREPPLQWGLRFIVRGDIMLDDGSFITLDELAREGGYMEPIPYLEEMEPELEVDFDA